MAQFQQAVGRSSPFVNVPPVTIPSQRAPETTDVNYVIGATWLDESPATPVLYFHLGGGVWQSNELTLSTDDTFAGALDTTASSSLAIKTYVDNTAVAGAPVATTTVAGIGQLATDAEAIAGTPSTGALALFVTPSNLAAVLAAGGPGSFTTLAASGAVTFSSTGAISMTSDTASLFDVTGAGVDLTLSSDAGRVIVNGEEAAANAITLLSAAGGIDADAALQVNIASSQNAADAIVISASAGGIDITAVGAPTEDIDISCTSGSINIVAGESALDSLVLTSTNGGIQVNATGASAGEDITVTASSSINLVSTENAAANIYLHANGGTSETIKIHADLGTGADSIDLVSDVGGVSITSGLASADAINLTASNGGLDLDGALQVNIASSQNAVDAIRIVASAGGIDIDAVGAATEDINITNTGGSILLVATEAVADAIVLTATTALGGIDVNGGTGGITVDSAGVLSLDSAGATNLTATGAFDVSIISTAGSVIVNAEEAVADAIQLTSAAGGLSVDVGLQIVLDSAEAAQLDSIRIVASAADGGGDFDFGSSGLTIDTTGLLSLDSAGATNLTATGAFDVTVNSTAGSVIIQGEQAVDDAIQLTSAAGGLDVSVALSAVIESTETNADSLQLISAGGCDLTATGAAGKDIDIVCTSGSVNLTAGENVATSMVFTCKGLDIACTGAAAQDIDIVNTGGSVNISATESVADAIVINANSAAGAVQILSGTGGVVFDSGITVNVTSTNTAATPYAVIGSDYFIGTDTTGGIMTVTLPASPATGRKVVIYDAVGQAGGNAVTIDGNGKNISMSATSAATKALSAAYSSAELVYNGTIWNARYSA